MLNFLRTMNQSSKFRTILAGIFRTGMLTDTRNTPETYQQKFRAVPAYTECAGRISVFWPKKQLRAKKKTVTADTNVFLASFFLSFISFGF